MSRFTGKRMTVRPRTRQGDCPRCRVCYVWTSATLLREARCLTCKRPLEQAGKLGSWPLVFDHPRISRVRTVQWMHLNTVEWGAEGRWQATGPITFVYDTGRRQRWRWDTRERAATFARRHHCRLREMPLPAGLRRHLPPVPAASTTPMPSSGTLDAPVQAARGRS
jgi:hypothetical protein